MFFKNEVWTNSNSKMRSKFQERKNFIIINRLYFDTNLQQISSIFSGKKKQGREVLNEKYS